MQISGRLVIVAMFVLAISMAAGAWLYQYSYSRRSAEFWGESSRLIGKSPELQFLVLESTPAEGDASGDDPTNAVAGRPVTDYHDLRNEKGLIHLRHVFIQDDNFSWSARQVESAASTREWAYALRFVEGPSEQVVLLGRDFNVLGKLSTDGKQVDVLPCPRIATPLQRYLTDVGALKPKAKSDVEPTVAAESAAR